jgi:Protein of unknown function (DUF2950)
VAGEAVVAVAAVAAGGGKDTMTRQNRMIARSLSATVRSTILAVAGIGFCCVMAAPLPAQSESKQASPLSAQPTQKAFATPQQALDAVLQAAADYNVPALLEILGPDGKDLVASGDQNEDRNRAVAFAAQAKMKNRLVTDAKNPDLVTIIVGDQSWPLPIPLVKGAAGWTFDSKVGREEILRRRIGANELDTITVCRGFDEAQIDYATEIHDNSGVNQYAQKIISTPGKQDGLAWKNPDGTWGGPIGENVAAAIEASSLEQGKPFHGYYYKILKGQGPSARLGQLDYMIGGAMIGGFALVAYPAEYRVTGVQTFIVSYDGVVYQKNLGPDTVKIAQAMERYDPDKTWRRTDDNW